MEDLGKWHRGSLPASIDALRAARKALGRTAEGAESARRIARSLRGTAEAYGLPALLEAARSASDAGPADLSRTLDRLIAELAKVAAALGPGDRPAILLIEDDPQMAGLLETILSAPDRELLTAGSAGEALAILEERPMTLIVLDLSLPDTDGRNFLVLLRERAATAAVPVIVLSGLGGPQPKSECFALGADAYFEKPLAPEVLKAAVSARLHKSVEHGRESRQDALTGLPNRASFIEGFRRAAAHAGRRGEPLALAVLDFDHLRRFNEVFGHVSGDAVLRHAARVFTANLRRSDLLARWGGDEFAMLLPGTALTGARTAVEKILSALAAHPYRGQDGLPVAITFSCGLVSVTRDVPVEAAMADADRCLFLAKSGGRARLVSEADQEGRPANRILLVEGDEALAAAIAESLGREGFRSERTADWTPMRASALAGEFSLCILDVDGAPMGPGQAGGGLLAELSHMDAIRRPPVLMLASPGSDSELAQGFRLGAADYLVKPFTPYDLMSRVHHLLRRAAPSPG